MSKPIFSDGIGYEGKVTLTLKSNGRVLKSTTYKNNGTALLFKFLGDCLIGSYEEAKQFIPNKILLLENTSTDVRDAKAVNVCSTWQTLAKMPAIISDTNTAQVKVIYSFEVPKAAISKNFNQVALYGADVNDIKEFSAYYYLTGINGDLEEQDIDLWSATTILLIEWELSLSNKNVEIATQGGQK